VKRGPVVVAQRVGVVVATIAAVLVPAWAAPAKTISVPITLARSVSSFTDEAMTLEFPASHVVFSWRGSEGSGVRFRTTDASGVTSEWARAPEAHDLEDEPEHHSGVLYVGRAVSVEWEPVARWGTWIGPVTLNYLNTVDGPRRTYEVPATAAAAAVTPRIVTRAEWGADESLKDTDGGCTRTFHPVQQLFVHHTAGSNGDPDPYATMRAIYYFHTVSRGWCDVGYNFIVAPDGTIFEARWARPYTSWETHTSERPDGSAVVGAHVSGYNSGSVGISMMGNFSKAQVPAPARDALVDLLAWEADRHNLVPTASHLYRNPDSGLTRELPYIAGHRDAGSTACPGDHLYKALPSIREEVAFEIGAGRDTPRLDLAALTPRVRYGSSASIAGRLLAGSGAPLVGRDITLKTQVARGGWSDTRVRTGTDGAFSFAFTAEKNTSVVATYAGDTSTWEARSALVKVFVQPKVRLATTGGERDEQGVTHFPPGTTRIGVQGSVVPLLPGRTVKLSVFRYEADGSETLLKQRILTIADDGSFTSSFRLGRRGVTYRAVVWYQRGGGYFTAKSESVYFIID